MTCVVFLVGSVIVSIGALLAALWLVFSGGDGGRSDAACEHEQPERLVAEVLEVHPHDPDAFTQGLLLDDSGRLWESTGLRGESEVRLLDVDSGDVMSSAALSPDLFGEGLTMADDGSLVQLTWTSGLAPKWSLGSGETPVPERTGEFAYDGEGWGITTLDDGFYTMSDGSNRLQFRTPDDFSVAAMMEVHRGWSGGPAERAGVGWQHPVGQPLPERRDTRNRSRLRRCGVGGGRLGRDRSGNRGDRVRRAATRCTDLRRLNGIAWLGPDHPDRYYVTGKRWPTLYEVTFAPA
ncbi:MAG: glutaminyl-peptide cyclotransferase [Microthrixaceae bacterium]